MTENNAAQPGLTTEQILSLERRGNMTDDEALRFGRAIESALLSKLRTEGVQAGAATADIALPDVLPELTTPGGAQYVSMATMQTVLRSARAALAGASVAGEAREHIEQMAVNRYRPVPDGMFSYKVVAGNGARSLYTGTKDSCLLVSAKLTEAFLDGAFAASNSAPQASEAVRDAALEEAAQAVLDDEGDSLSSHAANRHSAARIRALKAQADKDGAQSPTNRPESRASIESKGGALDGGDCAKGAGDELAPVFQFLLGEGPLRGVYFGDQPPDERGAYWWRKDLRAALAAQKQGDSDA